MKSAVSPHKLLGFFSKSVPIHVIVILCFLRFIVLCCSKHIHFSFSYKVLYNSILSVLSKSLSVLLDLDTYKR